MPGIRAVLKAYTVHGGSRFISTLAVSVAPLRFGWAFDAVGVTLRGSVDGRLVPQGPLDIAIGLDRVSVFSALVGALSICFDLAWSHRIRLALLRPVLAFYAEGLRGSRRGLLELFLSVRSALACAAILPLGCGAVQDKAEPKARERRDSTPLGLPLGLKPNYSTG